MLAQGYTAIHHFDPPLGASSAAPLLRHPGDGFLYGVTSAGGAHAAGTVFKMDADGNNFAVIHDFNTTDGAQPEAGLILASDGLLYGSTSGGGTFSNGTVFKIDTAGGSFATVRHFDGDADGEEPRGRLVQASDTMLYGVTHSGGAHNGGTLYRVALNGTAFAVLHAFGTSTEGTRPAAGLILASDGRLFGTTEFAAAQDGNGTVFRANLDGSALTTIHTFAGAPDDGETPSAELLEGSDGVLYGTTEFGGASNGGIVFAIGRDGNGFGVLKSLGGADGSRPRGPLVEDQALLWGTAYADGANNGGTLFHLTRAATLFDVVRSFASPTGDHPHAAVLAGNDGALYGTTEAGGANAVGVAYRFANPKLQSITPNSGPAAGGTPVTIAGTLFQSLAAVTVGGAVPTGISVAPGEITASTPVLAPGTLNDVIVTNVDKTIGSIRAGFFADFLDVEPADSFHDYIESIFRNGITAGCGAGDYCRNSSVTRAQMAVFLLKAKHGSIYLPPACTGVFGDVACPSTFADWIEQLAAEGITGGCGNGNYCPNNPVQRDQMAVFLLKAEHGSAYVPPPCAATFGDVTCPSLFADWIERLAAEGITGGCGGGNYCPTNSNTRGQMAVFLVKTFNLQ
jgi:uncharacterized repeat protein (TIGR03803 family)